MGRTKEGAMRDQIARLGELIQGYESLRKVAQYASRLWIEENGGELLERSVTYGSNQV